MCNYRMSHGAFDTLEILEDYLKENENADHKDNLSTARRQQRNCWPIDEYEIDIACRAVNTFRNFYDTTWVTSGVGAGGSHPHNVQCSLHSETLSREDRDVAHNALNISWTQMSARRKRHYHINCCSNMPVMLHYGNNILSIWWTFNFIMF